MSSCKGWKHPSLEEQAEALTPCWDIRSWGHEQGSVQGLLQGDSQGRFRDISPGKATFLVKCVNLTY